MLRWQCTTSVHRPLRHPQAEHRSPPLQTVTTTMAEVVVVVADDFDDDADAELDDRDRNNAERLCEHS